MSESVESYTVIPAYYGFAVAEPHWFDLDRCNGEFIYHPVIAWRIETGVQNPIAYPITADSIATPADDENYILKLPDGDLISPADYGPIHESAALEIEHKRAKERKERGAKTA